MRATVLDREKGTILKGMLLSYYRHLMTYLHIRLLNDGRYDIFAYTISGETRNTHKLYPCPILLF